MFKNYINHLVRIYKTIGKNDIQLGRWKIEYQNVDLKMKWGNIDNCYKYLKDKHDINI